MTARNTRTVPGRGDVVSVLEDGVGREVTHVTDYDGRTVLHRDFYDHMRLARTDGHMFAIPAVEALRGGEVVAVHILAPGDTVYLVGPEVTP